MFNGGRDFLLLKVVGLGLIRLAPPCGDFWLLPKPCSHDRRARSKKSSSTQPPHPDNVVKILDRQLIAHQEKWRKNRDPRDREAEIIPAAGIIAIAIEMSEPRSQVAQGPTRCPRAPRHRHLATPTGRRLTIAISTRAITIQETHDTATLDRTTTTTDVILLRPCSPIPTTTGRRRASSHSVLTSLAVCKTRQRIRTDLKRTVHLETGASRMRADTHVAAMQIELGADLIEVVEPASRVARGVPLSLPSVSC